MGKEKAGGERVYKKKLIFNFIDSSNVLTFQKHVCIIFHEFNYRCSARKRKEKRRRPKQRKRHVILPAILLDGHIPWDCVWFLVCLTL